MFVCFEYRIIKLLYNSSVYSVLSGWVFAVISFFLIFFISLQLNLGSGFIVDEQQFTFSNSSSPAEGSERKNKRTNEADEKDDLLRKYMQENEGFVLIRFFLFFLFLCICIIPINRLLMYFFVCLFFLISLSNNQLVYINAKKSKKIQKNKKQTKSNDEV